MKRKGKHTSKLYQYLEQTGALTASEAVFLAAKHEYRRLYQAEWRRRKRDTSQEVTVVLSPSELRIIDTAARKHRRSRPQFLKSAAIAYTAQTFVVPDILAVNTILEYLIKTYCEVQKLFDENKVPYEAGKEAMQQISMLEKQVQKAFYQPLRLEDWIASEIRKNPSFVETLRQLLNTA